MRPTRLHTIGLLPFFSLVYNYNEGAEHILVEFEDSIEADAIIRSRAFALL